MDKLKQWMYYFLIGIISMIALCFLPMIGSDVNLGWKLPTTFVGWTVWVVVKLIVTILNVLIFHCFMLQAKINVKDNDKYKEAQEILRLVHNKEYIPRSPAIWNKQQYSRKGVTVAITTALSTIALTQAILSFDWMSMLTYLFTIVLGIIFGIMQMNSAEDYWTDEFWQYAKQVERDMEMAKEECTDEGDDTSSNNSGTDILEPGYYFDPISLTSKPMVVDNDFSDYRFLGRAINPSNSTSNSSNITN